MATTPSSMPRSPATAEIAFRPRGNARGLAALLNRPLVNIQPVANETATPVESVTFGSDRCDATVPHYTARVIRGERSAPARIGCIAAGSGGPAPHQQRGRCDELCHVRDGPAAACFDFDKLDGRRIVVRNARSPRDATSLGHERGHRYARHRPMRRVPWRLPGVMGGRDSEVSDATVNVLLESGGSIRFRCGRPRADWR